MRITRIATLFGIAGLALLTVIQSHLLGAIGDCSAGLTLTTVSGAKCGGWPGTGMPCETTGSCQSPAETWMTSQPGCATGTKFMWATAPPMSTCQNVGSGSCSYCGGGTSPTSGMECASGHLYAGGMYCSDNPNPYGQPPNVVCAIVKYCGGSCCEL